MFEPVTDSKTQHNTKLSVYWQPNA